MLGMHPAYPLNCRRTPGAGFVGRLVVLILALVSALTLSAAEPLKKSFDIGADEAERSLKEFAAQSGVDVLFASSSTNGVRTNAVKGEYTTEEAMAQLLAGTPLFVTRNAKTGSLKVLRESDPNVSRAIAQDSDRPSKSQKADNSSDTEGVVKLDTFEVFGRKTLNMDIPRTRDDMQPYVVFSGNEVRRTGAFNLDEFFRSHLPMNSTTPSTGSALGGVGNVNGAIFLRGLSAAQTLILVDGRRVPGIQTGGTYAQPNINGIPPSAIERIEVLPATAGGIYGGGATAGVINIILKRDFSGFDIETLYGNTFDTDVGRVQLNFTGGFRFNEGRTRVMISASHSEQHSLAYSDRDIARRSFAIYDANFPSSSGLYANAYGPTANVVSQTGANLVLKPAYGGTALNSPRTFVPDGYTGPASDNASALLANAGKLRITGAPFVLYGAPTQDAVSFDFHHDIASHLEGYLSYNWNRNINDYSALQTASTTLLASDASNPFQQAIVVRLPVDSRSKSRNTIGTRRANIGLIATLPFHWNAALDYGWSQGSVSSRTIGINGQPTTTGAGAFNAAALSDLSSHPIPDVNSLFTTVESRMTTNTNTLNDLSVRVSGPLVTLPGGSITLSSFLEKRNEHNDGFVSTTVSGSSSSSRWTPEASQDVKSAYLELRAPLFSTANAATLLQELELMASIRRDQYGTRWAAGSVSIASEVGPFPPQTYAESRFASTVHTLGLRYAPVKDISFRASYGTGFLPPAISNIKATEVTGTPSQVNFLFPFLIDARRNEPILGDPTTGLITQRSGGDPNLKPEDSKSPSLGFVLTPRFLPGFRLSVDYTKITKRNEITSPSLTDMLADDTLYPGRILRAPLTPADTAAGKTAGRIISIDLTAINLFSTDVRAVDYQVDYSIKTKRWGDWHLYMIATQMRKYLHQTSPTVLPLDPIGFSDGPLEWRGNIGLDWASGPWAVAWNAQCFDHYRLYLSTQASSFASSTAVLAQGASMIPSQIYHDIDITYRFGGSAPKILAHSEIEIGIQNLFNKAPPVLAASGSYSSLADPRLRRYILAVRRHF